MEVHNRAIEEVELSDQCSLQPHHPEIWERDADPGLVAGQRRFLERIRGAAAAQRESEHNTVPQTPNHEREPGEAGTV